MKHANDGFDFFLGALAPGGFHGYFECLDIPPDNRLYLIKSGPGCGKSTLMKSLAAASLAAGAATERVHCSSDPDSLDGVVFWDKNAAIVDATAPHTVDPGAPGAAQQVVSLYDSMNIEGLRAHQCEILDLFRACAYYQERASRTMASAAGLLLDSRRTAAGTVDFAAARAFARSLSQKLIPQNRDGTGRETFRLLSAVTPQGILTYRDTVPALADQIVVFHDPYGAASKTILEQLRTDALARGWDIITCWCCMAPEEKPDHLFIPGLRLAFCTSNSWHELRLPGQRNIHCSRFMDTAQLRAARSRLQFNRKAAAQLLDQTSELQRAALETHGRLEEYYKSCIDFAVVDRARDRLIKELVG